MLMKTNLPNLLHRGKVRDTYNLGQGLLLMVATDRISAFDVVLPTGIPSKGLVLCRMSAFWFRETAHLVPNHFLALANDASALQALENGPLLEEMSPEVARQAMIVRRAQRVDIECIVRGYLAGSAWAEYQKHGTVSGHPMLQGLLEGQALPELLFTPTTKAEEGHDQNMTRQEVENLVGSQIAKELEEKSIVVYRFARSYAADRGIILADTKMEFGLVDEELILIDELLTPDSSRFWDAEGYKPGRPQPNFDKQFVRDWLTAQGWDREPPAPPLPQEVVARTSDRYREAYRRLTGQELPSEQE